MRGKFLHNRVMVAPLVLALERLGYAVSVEQPVRPGQRPPCADMFLVVRGRRIVIEAEGSCARIKNDLIKARSLQADLLLIVVPHARLRLRVQTGLIQLIGRSHPDLLLVKVLTLGAALRWISDNCPLVAVRLVAAGRQSTTP